LITVQGITKRFGKFAALNGVDLQIEDGEFVALLGPSGSGKTTLRRVIAGLEFQDAGNVLFDGEDVSNRPVAQRGVGFVFQQYALFRHMKVADNVAFGLSVRKWRNRPSRKARRIRADELLRLVHLEDLGDRYPEQLSGGQRQRVALARALVVEPRLLLLDEPFGALDAKVRKELRRWLRELHEQMGLTSIFVTHDQEEALELADRIVVLNQGAIEQVGTPEQVYMEPATPFVAGFVGETSWMPGGLHVRPHDLEIVESDGEPVLVDNVFRRGGDWRIEGTLANSPDELVEIDLDAAKAAPAVGETILVRPIRAVMFDSEEEAS
jgi:sulfate transport system ATP-binding protein